MLYLYLLLLDQLSFLDLCQDLFMALKLQLEEIILLFINS